MMVSRRDALGGAVALAGKTSSLTLAGVASAEAGASKPNRSSAGKAPIIASRDNAVVPTTTGRVRGYTRNGIQTFKGIPYAESTAGANRFMPPEKVKPWSGVRSSLHYGPVSPQPARTGWKNDEESFMFLWDDGIPGEDCLRVNVWTPALDDQTKRPVMVWLHGGGFFAGSGQELPAYDGENLARRGNVVVVSLNHRLGALGFLDLSHSKDERFARSGNVGMLDIVAALEWVRDNIAAFGGDPGSVTVFGQSGGGGKVAALMAMPSAHGLFHRAIVESGSMLHVRSPDLAMRLTDELLKELDLDDSRLADLQYLPYQQIIAAGAKILARQPHRPPDFRRMSDQLGWAPVNDGAVIPQHPFDPVQPQRVRHQHQQPRRRGNDRGADAQSR
jgi:para-nitrobenzyl esterase